MRLVTGAYTPSPSLIKGLFGGRFYVGWIRRNGQQIRGVTVRVGRASRGRYVSVL